MIPFADGSRYAIDTDAPSQGTQRDVNGVVPKQCRKRISQVNAGPALGNAGGAGLKASIGDPESLLAAGYPALVARAKALFSTQRERRFLNVPRAMSAHLRRTAHGRLESLVFAISHQCRWSTSRKIDSEARFPVLLAAASFSLAQPRRESSVAVGTLWKPFPRLTKWTVHPG